jgi:hypothetical protein
MLPTTPALPAALYSARVRVGTDTQVLVVYENGMQLGSRPGRGRLVTWGEVSRLSDGPPADRFGLVVDGRLILICEEEQEANDRAADQRRLGLDVAVIRVPVTITA